MSMKNNKELHEFKKQIRIAIANYMKSEGCDCCQNIHEHERHEEQLAKLLNVSKYSDNSGYDFSKYQTK